MEKGSQREREMGQRNTKKAKGGGDPDGGRDGKETATVWGERGFLNCWRILRSAWNTDQPLWASLTRLVN